MKKQKMRKSGTQWTTKWLFVYGMRSETGSENLTLFDRNWERVHWATPIFCHPVAGPWMDLESAAGVTNTFYWVGEFTDTKFMNNEAQL